MNKSISALFTIVLSLMITIVLVTPSNAYTDSGYVYLNEKYHSTSWGSEETHWWQEEVTPATIYSNGRIDYKCYYCGGVKASTYFSWRLVDPAEDDSCCSYNVTKHSPIFRKSKKVTVWLDNAVPGSVVNLKIGKKTYKKKVGLSKKVKIKIKNPKYGKHVSIKVMYKGTCIGTCWEDEDDIVYYAKDIKKGMTKKQVKCLYYWGGTDDTASSAGGWSYWYYDDGSYIDFKNGKVRYWYNAAG